MAGFNNKEVARRAGQRSSRGENKIPILVKKSIATFIEGKLSSEEMEKLWNELQAADKMRFLLGLLPYIITPKKAELEAEQEQTQQVTVEFISKDSSILISN